MAVLDAVRHDECLECLVSLTYTLLWLILTISFFIGKYSSVSTLNRLWFEASMPSSFSRPKFWLSYKSFWALSPLSSTWLL